MFLFLDTVAMIRDIRRQGLAIDLWGALLNFPQIVGGLVFIARLEGLLVFATAIVTLLVAGQIHKRARFSRLTGLCHLPWLVLLPWLLYRLQTVEHGLALKIWGYYVAATMLISLIFDAIDVYRYSRGQKKFAWAK